jgi:hypothetical protein
MDEPKTSDLFKLLAPFLAGTVMVTLLCVVLLLRFGHFLPTSNVNAVTFDIVKFSNAQRAVASAFLKKTDVAQANDLLLGLSERTRKAITEIAGPNTVVLVKESVAQGVDRDITDAVLKKLGLPVNVPTSDAAAYTLDVAPTMLAAPLSHPRKPTASAGDTTALP